MPSNPIVSPLVRRYLLAATLAIPFLLVLTLAGCRKKEVKEEKLEDRISEVQAGDFRISISATGKVIAHREVQILSKASGEVTELPFEAGAIVKKGDLLARVDPIEEQRNVQKAEAALQSTKARLEIARNQLNITKSNNQKSLSDAESGAKLAQTRLTEAEAKHKRQEQLFERKLISKEELETSLTQLEQARTDLTRARATVEDTRSLPFQIAAREQDITLAGVDVRNAEIQLDEAKKRLADTEINSPMDGVLTDRKLEIGQVISSPLGNVGGGTPLMTVSDLSSIYLVAAVDESDIGGVAIGHRALISTDAFPEVEFEGAVHHIAPLGVALNNVVTFDVKIRIEGEGVQKLKPGMTADATIIFDESLDTLWVQSEAIQEKDGETFIERQLEEPKEGEERKVEKVSVKPGLTDGLMTEIVGDVKQGDQIVVRADESLSEWERGGGGNRPMRGGFGFGGGKKDDESDSETPKSKQESKPKPKADSKPEPKSESE